MPGKMIYIALVVEWSTASYWGSWLILDSWSPTRKYFSKSSKHQVSREQEHTSACSLSQSKNFMAVSGGSPSPYVEHSTRHISGFVNLSGAPSTSSPSSSRSCRQTPSIHVWQDVWGSVSNFAFLTRVRRCCGLECSVKDVRVTYAAQFFLVCSMTNWPLNLVEIEILVLTPSWIRTRGIQT